MPESGKTIGDNLNSGKKMTGAKTRDLLYLLGGLLTLIAVNFIGSKVFFRVDFTEDKRHTLSKPTIDLLEGLEEVAYVKVYLDGDMPAAYKKLSFSIREKLENFKAYAKGNLVFEFIDPSSSKEPAENRKMYKLLTEKGLRHSSISIKQQGEVGEKIIFPGAIITYKEQEAPVQFFKKTAAQSEQEILQHAVNDIEYEFTNALRKFLVEKKKRIAFIEGHGELEPIKVADISKSLSEYYQVERVNIGGRYNALNGFDAIIIAKPTKPFPEIDKFVIDQFIMNGGRSLWAIDPMDVPFDSLQGLTGTGEVLALANKLNIEDQLFKYGARVNPDLVLDLSASPIALAMGNSTRPQLYPWYYAPLSLPFSKHPIVKGLDAIKFNFASTIDTVGNPEVTKTIMLTSSRYARVLKAPVRVSFSVVGVQPDKNLFQKSFLPLGVLLEGNFESIFQNRMPPGINEVKGLQPKENSVPNKMIVVGDGDIIENPLTRSGKEFFPLGYDKYRKIVHANTKFILNAMNYLLDDEGFLAVRSNDVKMRALDSTKITSNRTYWQIFNMVFPIVTVLILGLLQLYLRRRKFARS